MAEYASGIGQATGGTRSTALSNEKGSLWPLVSALYLVECLLVVIVMLVYRAEGKANWKEFLSSRPGLLSVAAAVAVFVAVGFIVGRCRAGLRNGNLQWLFALVMNLGVVSAILLVGELGLRSVTVHANTQDSIFGKLLYPRQWKEVAIRFKDILGRAEREQAFWVEDRDLGWIIGANRKSADGLYFSSAEGLRSAALGQSFRETDSPCRIALVGDSYTFGEEVSYEHAWASMLEREFGPHCQILNFGVGGYGVDQMYLRYMRDVRSWKPNVVVFAFVNHDAVRTFSVYSFLLFPGGETPFAKPRFVFRGNALVQINRPLISPAAIFEKPTIRELPFIEHDANYKETEWDRPGWEVWQRSYLFRLMTSAYPLHEKDRQEISDESLQSVNQELFRAFRETASADGALPLIVYLPSVGELPEKTWWEPVGLKILREGRIPHLDLRECMAAAYTADTFMPPGHGQHYSSEGNRAVARCLSPVLHSLLEKQPSSGRRSS